MTTAHKVASRRFLDIAQKAATALDKRALQALTFTIHAHMVVREKDHETRLLAGAKGRRPRVQERSGEAE